MIDVDSNSQDALLSAREAARLLGVKLPSLYAYASRGLVGSVPSGKGRARLYSRSEILRLKARHDARSGHGPVAGGALRWGEPVLDTAITGIEARGPRYRGKLAVDLAAEHVPFEAVAELLWTSALPEAFPTWLPEPPPLAALRRVLRAPASALDALALVVPLVAIADPERGATATAVVHARARALIATLVAAIALRNGQLPAGTRLPPAGTKSAPGTRLAARLAEALGALPTKRNTLALDVALVLLADHELNASTFAARVAASAGADLYACVAAALATLSGPRHGGESLRVEALLAEAKSPEGARALVSARTRRAESVPGFSHPLYPDGDPRAAPLLALARALAPRSPALATLDALCDAMLRIRDERPNVDVGLVALGSALGAPPGSGAAIFAVARAAGWVAHSVEQRESGVLLRPRARYVGVPE